MAEMYSSLAGKPVKRFLRLLSVERKDIYYIYIYAIFNGILYLSLPLGVQAIIGLVLANQISSSWIILTILVTLGTLAAGGLQIMQLSITERLQQRLFTKASFEFAYRIPRFQLSKIEKYYPPELVNRFFDVLNIQKGLPKILIDLSTATLQIIFGLILLSFYHPFFIFFGLGLIFILVLIFQITGPRGLYTSLQESDYKYKVVHWLEELARTLRTFKMAGETPLPLEKTNKLVNKYLDARKQHFVVLARQYGFIIGFKALITAGLLLLGSLLLIQREINIGQFVASEIIILLIISSAEKLILSMDTIYDVLTATEKIGKVTDIPLEQAQGFEFEQVGPKNCMMIDIKDLSIKADDQSGYILKNISLEVFPGEKFCISGFSGSGKTLLANTLAGLQDKYEGIIAINGIPLRNYNLPMLRARIGECLSQKTLFEGTLLDNLTLGRQEVSNKDVQFALETLGLMNFVQSLSDGLYTEITPEGVYLPQSVVQKLVLARCIAKRPNLLVIDDIFTSMEKMEKERIIEYLTHESDCTLIAVSNDAYFASQCDRIVIMEKGIIVGQGDFETVNKLPAADKLFFDEDYLDREKREKKKKKRSKVLL